MNLTDYVKGKDYCTSFPEHIGGINYSRCCQEHDIHYQGLVPPSERLSRFKADVLLFKCVLKRVGLTIALVMFIGVRLFGGKHYE